MNQKTVRTILIANFCLFACLACVEGPVILATIKYYDASYRMVSYIPSLRDVINIIVSVLAYGSLMRLGYRRALMYGLFLLGASCIIFSIFGNYWTILLLYACIGAIFAIAKICIFTMVSAVTDKEQKHAKFMSILEGFFMASQFASYWIFAYFFHHYKANWIHVYLLFGIVSLILATLWIFIPFDESSIQAESNKKPSLTKLIRNTLHNRQLLIILIAISIYVFYECSVFAWLPTFYHVGFGMNISSSTMAASLLLFFMMCSRIGSAFFIEKLSSRKVVNICALALPLFFLIFFAILYYQIGNGGNIDPHTSSTKLLILALVFPLIGLFMGPLYPLLASRAINLVGKLEIAALLVLMQVTEGIGAVSGQQTMGFLFNGLSAYWAFAFLLIPTMLLLIFSLLISD